MSYLEQMMKTLRQLALMIALTALATSSPTAQAQDQQLYGHLPPNPDLIAIMNPSKAENLEKMSSGQGGSPSETISASLLRIPKSQIELVSGAAYGIKDAFADFSPQNAMQGVGTDELTEKLSEIGLQIEKLKSSIDPDVLDRVMDNLELLSHNSVDYYRIKNLPSSLQGQFAEGTCIYMPSDTIVIAGSENLVKQSIDTAGGTPRSSLFDHIRDDKALSVAFQIPEGSLSGDLIPGAGQNPMVAGMLALISDMQVFSVSMDMPGDTFDLDLGMKFSEASSASALELPLQQVKQQYLQTPDGTPSPMAPILSGVNISTSNDVLSISAKLPREMIESGLGMAAGGGPSGDISGLPDMIRLVDGTTVKGKIIDPIDEGVIVDLDTGGGFSRRYHWSEMDIPTLESFSRFPQINRFVRDYIPKERSQIRNISLLEPPPVKKPNEGRGFLGALFSTPLGIGFLVLIYALNIWVGIEVAIFRGHPVALVAGASAIMPLISPLIFYFIPAESSYTEEYIMDDEEFVEEEAAAPASGTPSNTGAPKGFSIPEPEGGGLSLSGAASKKPSAGGALAPGQRRVYKRGQVDINRSFIEQTFPPFFRTVITGPEKDQVIDFKTPKATMTAKRISRMSSNEVYVMLQSGGTEDKGIKIAEISEIVVRHKDDRG